MSEFCTFDLLNYRQSVVNSSARPASEHLPLHLRLHAPEWADLPGDRQFGNYFTIYIALDLTWPGDREGGNYLSHFLGQRIIECEKYDHFEFAQ